MKLHVLVDNNTLIDRYFLAEPGLSFLIEDKDVKVLFDTGYSDIFLINAHKMGCSLSDLDFLVLSHNHLDHTWGIEPLIRHLTERRIERLPVTFPVLVAHPDIFTSVDADGFNELGPLISESKAARHFTCRLSRTPVKLTPGLTFLGQIPRENKFEGLTAFGRKADGTQDDLVMDDSALVFTSSKGLVIMTGCSHAGICNIVDYARSVCGDNRVADVIGGFHLQNPSEKQMEGTADYFRNLNPAVIHACHCTDLPSKIALSRAVRIEEVGSGLTLTYDE